MTVVDDTPKS